MLTQTTVDQFRSKLIAAQNMFVDGKWVSSSSSAIRDVISPIDGSVITTTARGTKEDVNLAVSAARNSYNKGAWSRSQPAFRKRILHRIGELISEHAIELAVLGTRDNGTEIQTSIMSEPGSSAATFHHSAECIDKLYGEIAPTGSATLGLIHKVPVGVVGVIVPWNAPLMITAWKISAALAMGNSVVLKPAEDASLAVLKMTELCAEAGLPEGVLNVVTGSGSEVGNAIARHMDVDVLAFTGSGQVGRQLLHASAESNLKRVYLELGGKSPNIVFADAPDLDKAASISAKAFFKNAGQICVSPSRLLVEASIHDEFIAKVVENAKAISVGNPLDVDSQMGAITNEAQMDSIKRCVADAITDGGDVLTGGTAINEHTGGNYFAPTIVGRVSADHKLFKNEVFGPVLSATPFTTEEEALELANSTVYGLASCVWTNSLSRAHRMIAGIESGMVQVNSFGPIDNVAPLGGVKQSGNGVDKSLHAFEKYTNLKTAWIHL